MAARLIQLQIWRMYVHATPSGLGPKPDDFEFWTAFKTAALNHSATPPRFGGV
jgi:hypothetical protein